MDWEKSRFLMIEQQIRTWSVLEPNILDRLLTLKREEFVPETLRELAFTDMELPLGVANATMLEPKMEARIVQEVGVLPTDKVLVIGNGSGYLAALLASFAQQVYAVEIEPELVTLAEKNLQQAGISNVTLALGDGSAGVRQYAPYDIIVVTASMPFLPLTFKEELNIGGRIFAVLGEAPAMKATLITRVDENRWTEKHLFETVLPRLINIEKSNHFIF